MTMPALMQNYARVDVAFEHGEGAWLTATDGRRYLDFGAGIAVNALGHAHPRLVEVLREQAAKVWHTSNLYRVPGQEQVAATLVANTFADSVYFCSTGLEANEAAMKMARKVFHDAGAPERDRFVVAGGAFHGRSFASIAAGGNPKHMEGYGTPMDAFDRVAFGNMNEARQAVGERTCAVLVEPVQGEGGIRPAPVGYLRALREMCDEYGLLLILDEVQTGIGRTGTLFAYEHAGVSPDILTAAKGLGGGFPVGAVLATERCARAFTAGAHGTTFGGNPLAMAVAQAVLDEVLAPGFLDRVARVGAYLGDALTRVVADYPKVLTETRGIGLMRGLVCTVPNGDVITACRDQGLLLVPASDNVARLLPPLIIDTAEADLAIESLRAACATLAK
ncbi:aspartate aminotransferase family protein [Roseospira marina]|uniref:Acetylornithine aminotransferase n=1 Tax=Roseospira marina TaxID=140057 RepID=A0A5M6IF62_9PROT|nr:aspartate aminotransferase family protein [Roseospira marina]KAA5606926.1 aspartate aminotransferase family protein [Roseospira marina]MBB4312901.1 acetylornithine/N-succinyldiaminopimelate aminotransferase [Roseospira marina]MBB5086326.1 acetylornithine/N-succinyldiaminopimelate aminotransferase [Roseospira marina]